MLSLLDGFVGVNGTALPAHVPDVGGPWVDDTPGWKIQGNLAQQTADSVQTHVVTGGKLLFASVLFDLNGSLPGNSFQASLFDPFGNDGMLAVFGANGGAGLTQVLAGNPVYNQSILAGTFSNPGIHQLLIAYGADLVIVLVDGVPLFVTPRKAPKNEAISHFQISSGALGGGNPVLCSRVSVDIGG